MNENLEKIKEAFLKVWGNLSSMQKIIFSAAVVLFFAFLIIFSLMSGQVRYEPLFTELEPKDAAVIKEQRDKKGVKYRIADAGQVIEVEASQKYNLRLDLANEGVVPRGNSVGFEIFDSIKLSATEFEKKVMFLRAQEGELERTIRALKQVKRANVTITPSNDSPFLEDQTPAKASVLLELESFEKLNEENIKGIMLLVASAVESLTPETVDVMDTEGNILSEIVEFGNESSGLNNKKIQLQKELEKKFKQSAASVLSVLGGGNYRLTLSIELDFDKEEIAKEMFSTPTINGEEMTEGLKRSIQESEENHENMENDTVQGTAGTDSNIPGYVGTEEENNGNRYNKSNQIVNYELNKTQSSFTKAVGTIKRLSISVNINQKASYFNEMELTAEKVEEEKRKFINMVKNAVGFKEERGDSINVEIIPFDMQRIAQYEMAIKSQEKQKTYTLIALSVLIGIIVLSILGYYLIRKREEKLLKEKERRAVEDLIPEFDEILVGKQLSVEDQERMEKEDEIKEIAKKKPEEVAGLVRAWLTDD